MHHSAWGNVIQFSAWFVIMSLVMGWLGRNRLKPRPAGEAGTLRQPVSTLVIGIVCLAFFLALAVLSVLFPGKDPVWWTTACFLGFTPLGLAIIAEYYYARHAVSDFGLDYGSMRGRRGSMRWADVRSLRYGASMKWFRIEDAHGNVARLSAMLAGLPEFAQLALRHVPAEALDGPTWDVLERTAQGNPPPIW